jgi:acetone carboxylase gamma subunit
MDHEPPKAENAKNVEAKSEEAITEGKQGVSCSSCKAKMHEGKTKIRISGWEESGPKQSIPVSEASEKEWLPVRVYLCPQCGKIELVAE